MSLTTNNNYLKKFGNFGRMSDKYKIFDQEEDYLFSSARNYAGLDNYLDIELITPKLKTYN